MKTLRVAVVGLSFGVHHVRTLANTDGVTVVAVADSNESRSAEVAAAYGCKAYADAARMMDEERLDALFVCVSPRRRAAVLKPAVERGIALFVEKPWAAHAEHAAELADLCKERTAPIMVGFSFRFHPVIRRAIELVNSDLGSVRLGNASYIFSYLPTATSWFWDPDNGGGYFNENSCHLFDIVCALAGHPRELFAYGIRTDNRPSETGAVVALQFESGATVGLSLGGVGTASNHDFPWFEMCTEHGWIRGRGTDHFWNDLSWSGASATEVNSISILPEQLGRTRYSDAFEHFISCVRSGKEPAASVEDGVLMVQIADAVRNSLASGAPVALEAP